MYVITLCDTDSVTGDPLFGGQLQFFHCAFLQQSLVKKSCPMIIGLARGREGAMDLVCRIVQECMDRQHNADLVRFLARRDSRIALSGSTCESGVRMAAGQGELEDPWGEGAAEGNMEAPQAEAAVDQTDAVGSHTAAGGRKEDV